MAKATLKTTKRTASAAAFLNSIEDKEKRKDAKAINTLMQKVTGEKGAMWGESIVGFGDWHYVYSSGREGDWFRIGFSPRKQNLTLYFMGGYENLTELLEKLGPYKTGKSCLYIKRLSDVHMPTLKKIIKKGWVESKNMKGC